MKSLIDVFNGGQKKWQIGYSNSKQNTHYRLYRGAKTIVCCYIGDEGIYELIHNPEYAFIETIKKDEKTVADFCKKHGYILAVLFCGNQEGYIGYWQEYIINRLKETK